MGDMGDSDSGGNVRHAGRRRLSSNIQRKNGGVVNDVPEQRLADLIIRLGDVPYANSEGLPRNLLDLSGILLASTSLKEITVETVVSCVLALPSKIPLYSILTGLIAVQDQELGWKFINAIKSVLHDSIIKKLDLYKIKYISRFIMCLYRSKVISSSSVISYLNQLITMTCEDSNVSQRFSDAFMLIGLITLAYGGDGQLLHSESTWNIIDSYMERRDPRTSPVIVQPVEPSQLDFTIYQPDLIDEDFLGMSYQLVRREVGPESNGHEINVMWRLWENEQIALALWPTPEESDGQDMDSIFGNVNWLDDESLVSISFGELLSQQRPVYKTKNLYRNQSFIWCQLPGAFAASRATFRIFPSPLPQLTEDDVPLNDFEEYLMEDISLDTCYTFRGACADLSKHVSNLPCHSTFHNPLLVQVLFSEMLQVHTSSHPMVHYGAIFLNLCLNMHGFVPFLAEAIERLYGSIDSLSIPAFHRFAEWFAFHLSNTDFRWSWQYWEGSLDPKTNSIRHEFVQEALMRTVRLSYHERIAQAIPNELSHLLPIKFVEPNDFNAQSSPLLSELVNSVHLHKSSEDLLAMVHSACPLESVASTSQSNISIENLLVSFTHGVLLDGGKSITHLQATLDRCKGLYFRITEDYQICDQGKFLLKAIFDFYTTSPHHIFITVFKFCENQLLDYGTFISYLFEDSVLDQYGESSFLYEALDQTLARLVLGVNLKENEVMQCIQESNNILGTLDEDASYLATENLRGQLSLIEATLDSLFINIFDNFSQISSSASDHSARLVHMISDYLVFFGVRYIEQFVRCLPTLDILFSAVDPLTKQKFDMVKTIAGI